MDVTASDISEDALSVAAKNKENLNANITLLQSDWFSNIQGRFDIIVSNPPYIPNDEVVDAIVSKDPSIALYGGQEGTRFYETILSQAHAYLNEKGLIAFEHGYQQAQHIYMLAKQYFPKSVIIQKKDLAGKDRLTLIGIGGILHE